MRMCRVILTSVACPALQHFSTLYHKRHDFQVGKVTEHKMCVLIFSSIFSKPFLIIRRTERESVINIQVLKWSTRYSCQILIRRIFWIDFRKTNQILWKIRPVEVELFYTADGRTDTRTDMPELVIVFRKFANKPKNYRHSRSRILYKLRAGQWHCATEISKSGARCHCGPS